MKFGWTALARRETIKTELGQRLRAIREHFGDPGRDVFSLRLGISEGSLGNYERGDRVPDSSVLTSYREVLGVDVNWIVSGVGDMFSGPKAKQAPIDAEIMEILSDKVAATFHAAGQKAPQRRIAREAANLYNALAEIVPDLTDRELVETMIPVVLLTFKRQLEQAAKAPGTGKRSA